MASSTPQADQSRSRANTTSTTSSIVQTVRSTAGNILASDPPVGFFAATADAAARAPTLLEIRRGSFGHDGWRTEPQVEQRKRTMSTASTKSVKKGPQKQASAGSSRGPEAFDERDEHGMIEPFPALTEEPSAIDAAADKSRAPNYGENIEPAGGPKDMVQVEEPEVSIGSREEAEKSRMKLNRVYTSGYIPPPKVPWTKSTAIGFKGFLKWLFTPFGFLLTLYGLNVVAWGGMLFLLLCNASKVMCYAPVPDAATAGRHSLAASLALKRGRPLYYNCNDLNSPRRIWLEIDSQILNALFCVTGFGLVPWRFRDLYYLLRWRLTSERSHGREKKMYGLRVLAGIHQNWFRLPGSDTQDEQTLPEYEQTLVRAPGTSTTLSTPSSVEAGVFQSEADIRVPLPLSKKPEEPLTGIRAPPTALWKLDFFVWCQVWNTFFQCCLCGFMWGEDRYDRPSWSTGLFIALACIIAGVAGFMSFLEGKGIKRVEGVRAPNVEAAAEEMLDLGPGDVGEKRKEEKMVR